MKDFRSSGGFREWVSQPALDLAVCHVNTRGGDRTGGKCRHE